jgi:predicted TIM-barrel fold metal-dependent hydrolase
LAYSDPHEGRADSGIEDLLLRVPSPIVFDHLGRLAQPNALDNPGFRTISKLIDKGKTWVKLSGDYQDSKVGTPSYSDTVPVARAYVGERLATSDGEGKAERCHPL